MNDEKNKRLVLKCFSGKPTSHKIIPYGKGVCGQVANKKKTIIVDDVESEENYISCNIDVKSEIVVPLFLNNIIISDTSYYAIADAIRILSIVDSSSAKNHIVKLLSTESHNDVIRKSAISYFGQVISQSNYNTLKKMLEYGSFSWASRPTIVYQLARYQKKYPDLSLIHI